jgi:hypothetical protein
MRGRTLASAQRTRCHRHLRSTGWITADPRCDPSRTDNDLHGRRQPAKRSSHFAYQSGGSASVLPDLSNHSALPQNGVGEVADWIFRHVRMLLVPATMRLVGDANWWAPAPLRRFYARHGIREEDGPEPDAAARPVPAPAGTK